MTKHQGKHFMNNPATIVSDSIKGFCYANPHVRYIPEHKVVYHAKVDQLAELQVTLISGGGSGHDPAHVGYVGDGMLTAAVCGHVFASPSASQVLAAIKRIQSPHGTLVIVKNYTGDCLNFGVAVERAKAQGIKVAMLIVGDDIAIGRKKGDKVGRRGLAMVALVSKCCGALAAKGASLEQVAGMGQYVIDHSATLGMALDHCHVPSLDAHSLGPNETELGLGIHNEPGLTKLPLMDAKGVVKQVVDKLVDQDDDDRAYLNLPTDGTMPVVLVVNNLGGTPSLEFNVIVKEAVEAITNLPHLHLERVLSGSFVTSLDMPGFSLSLLTLNDNRELILELLDHPVHCVGWSPLCRSTFTYQEEEHVPEKKLDISSEDVASSQGTFPKVIHNVIQAIIQAEPTVTSYDTILGDGDCGHTLKSAAQAIEKALPTYPFSSTSNTLVALADTIDHNAGGTCAAIYCIFLNALANNAKEQMNDLQTWGKAGANALVTLQTYTRARVGDRTMMDVLIPFIDTLNQQGATLSLAVEAARHGLEATRKQRAQLGRASYLDDKDVQASGIPDAGAFGLMAILDGIYSTFV
ncbi:Dak1 domain-containing protein [Chlamydoabsidia padenii]|nr:Dak1 domain-containing protein [Chlamydoabsidia padenii]